MSRISAQYFLLCLWLAASPLVFAQLAVPPLKTRITDLTGTLTPSQQANLESRLQAFEASKGSQIAVLIVPTTAPEAIEPYAIRVAEAWELGRNGIDDGALLLIAKNDRALRIEVGYGLEGVLTDATANRIINEFIVPYVKHGDFYGGITAGLERMIRVIEGEPLPPPSRSPGRTGNPMASGLLMAVVAAVLGGGLLRALFGRFFGAIFTGLLVGLLASWMVAPVLGIIIGIIAFLFTLGGGTGGRRRRGGFGGVILPGGVGSGGGGLGGGFRGGGGTFGGGGASGRW